MEEDLSLLALQTIETVELDSLAACLIMKNYRESLPQIGSGLLLGIDAGKTMQISNILHSREIAEGVEIASADILQTLSELNFDSEGWYTCATMGNYCNLANINSQYIMQKNNQNSLLIVYDHTPANNTSPFLALRLTSEFMEVYRDGNIAAKAIEEASSQFIKIFEHVPLTILTSGLMNAAINQLASESTHEESKSLGNSKQVPSESYVLKHFESLTSSVEELASEKYKQSVWVKSYENAKVGKDEAETAMAVSKVLAVQPGILKSLIIANRIEITCQRIEDFVSVS